MRYSHLYHKYSLPVISIIVYPFRTKVATPPLEIVGAGEVILTFNYRVFPLWLLDARHYMQEHIIAMYALLPAMLGANGQLLDAAIDELVEYYRDDEITLARDLIWMGIILRRTDCVLEEDKRMIQERLSMYDDLMEKDPEMQRLRAKYKTEGLTEGKAEGLQEAILTIVKTRFPALAMQAQTHIAQITDASELRDLFGKLLSASDEVAVRTLLSL